MDTNAFSTTINGKEVSLYKISNQFITCFVTNYGARVVSLTFRNSDNQPYDVVLGFDSIQGYLNADEKYHGATVGRFANRIANGRFLLNDIQYDLSVNNPPNSLHAGPNGFHNQVWDVVSLESDKVVLRYISPDMEEGFPGELETHVTYSLKGSDLIIKYKSQSTKDTVINLTHHSYFNLNGEGAGSILDHDLMINSEYFTPVNEYTIPTGQIELIDGTPFDFRKSRKIGSRIEEEDRQLTLGFGYDHNYVVNQYEKGVLSFLAKASGDKSKISMEVWSTEPGVQFYTGNHLSGMNRGKSGSKYKSRNAFCLETQHFPDSPNQNHFPSAVLKQGEIYKSTTEYRFSNV